MAWQPQEQDLAGLLQLLKDAVRPNNEVHSIVQQGKFLQPLIILGPSSRYTPAPLSPPPPAETRILQQDPRLQLVPRLHPYTASTGGSVDARDRRLDPQEQRASAFR
ncbi:hypothetical protein BC936DRAFT_143995 [Jimgerdemannia flammicorona]|uniref:Uncharacterized protein n=1 Tax=Jimgerdemannia flammicorona TaxID=994334 RepID=A0A432ZY83_9FUNG|nr:hypothetical protein BC936DRAFT_143995 [Jimgerdemannia flammicorona]